MTLQKLIDALSDIRNEYGNHRVTVHYSPSTNIVKLELVGIFSSSHILDPPASLKLNVTTNKD